MLIRKLGQMLIEVVYPRLCPLCLCRLQGHELGVCMSCAQRLPLYNAVCHKAHERLYSSKIFGELYAVLSYRKGMSSQRLIHAFKYRGYARLAELFAQMFEAMYLGLLARYDCIIPVPISSGRFTQRGYNQAELLAKAIGRRCNVPVSNCYVVRVEHEDQSQTIRRRLDRHTNVSSAFVLNRERVQELRGKSILLVDDVLTTGATMMAVLTLLEEAGVARVDVCVAAVALFDL